MVKTHKEALKLANAILNDVGNSCGCISIFTENCSTTIRYGTECSRRCFSFTGCPRSGHDRPEPPCECGEECDDPRNYQ
jgi:hypothetical protein